MKVTRRRALQTVASAPGLLLGQVPPLRMAGRDVQIVLSNVTAQTVRIQIQPIENGQPVPIPIDGALVEHAAWPERARFGAFAGTRNIRCGDLMVKLAAVPLGIRVEAKGGALLQEFQCDPAAGKLTFRMGDAPLLGLGEGGPQFDRRGNADRSISGQGGYRLGTHGGRVPIQLAIGSGGWAMFVHLPIGAWDLTGKEGVFQFENLPLDLFVIGAREPAAVLQEYARITGLPEMAPLWSFGYQQSHRTLGPPEEIIQEARTFREKKLPCDAMIYLGTEFCPNGWNTRNGEFTWKPEPFPDPQRAIDQLHAEHMKVVLHIVFEGRRLTGTVHDPCTAQTPSGRTPDNRWPPDRQAACYWPYHKPLVDLGVDGWWPDQGDGLDGPSRLARNRMYFEGQQMYRPNQRVYALHRNGYAGMQRFAAFLWSGDVQSTWETLKTHVPVAVNTALSGIPYWGTDIAGFVPTKDLSAELYLRWFQFAAFCPLFRAHGRTWKLRLPWGWNTGDPGPIETPGFVPTPAELHDGRVEPICRKYLNLRYQMMPYLYSAVRECTRTGMPILRALWLHYPEDAAAVARGDEYLWGRDILVAPVVEKSATERRLYLPRGGWHDFWTEERQQGGREIARKVDLETTPLYVRDGAIIPMGPVKQYTAEVVAAPLTVHIYPGADGSFLLYEDDGATFDFKRGAWMGIQMAWNDRQRTLSMRLAPGSRMLAQAPRPIEVKLGEQTRRTTFGGRPVEVRF